MISNKPIITKATYDEYSAHIICAFNTMIHLVKETVEKPVYEKVRNMLQMGNKLVINDLIVKILKNIFRESYSEIEFKIISETNIKDNPTPEENRFIFFIRCLQAFRNVFPDIKYMWLEKDVRSIKEANLMFTSNFGERKTDLLILSLCRPLGNNLDCNIEDAKNVKTYSIQVIGDQLTLFAISLAAVIRNEFLEQEKLLRKICAFIPTDNYSENLREWLHLPDDDISLVTEEDMDKIFL
ncbi:hypothetical protein C2G38_2200012 [Gigaspora rosea]|uniref:Uncharacterized protein n=1 Tax=Gigaspora rosea TaxID=44941 RepID=A0A397UQS9_9GLOM|nr:hypothetical protein C2G38_2200012 [Gigaspora rosea]CAG8538327.1 21975_t:CDS:2 [Gigaspora rosea]